MVKTELSNLKKGQVIVCEGNKDIINTIEYLRTQLDSCQNLFNTFMQSSIEEVNSLNLNRLIEVDAEKKIQVNKLQEMLLASIVKDLESFNDKYEYSYFIDYNSHFITLTIEEVK